MSENSLRENTSEAQQVARLRHLRIAPRKVRSVADVVRGISVNEAEARLSLQRQRAAKPILKLLRSAVANAKSEKRLNVDNLYVAKIAVDGGPMLKRYLPRARGLATPIQKKTSHVTIVLKESPGQLQPRFKFTEEKKKKLPPGMKGRAPRKEKSPREAKVSVQPQKPGFFRKIFSRKSLAAK